MAGLTVIARIIPAIATFLQDFPALLPPLPDGVACYYCLPSLPPPLLAAVACYHCFAIAAYVCLSLFNTQTCFSAISAMSFAVRFDNRFALSPAVRSMHLPTAARCLSSYLLFIARHSRPVLIRCLFSDDRFRYSLPAVAIRRLLSTVCYLLLLLTFRCPCWLFDIRCLVTCRHRPPKTSFFTFCCHSG